MPQMTTIGVGELIDAKLVTPNASTDATNPELGNAIFGDRFANRIRCGANGNINIQMANGGSVLFTGVLGGDWMQMPPFKHVLAASTSATTIMVGYARS